jgi:hypothetical protein
MITVFTYIYMSVYVLCVRYSMLNSERTVLLLSKSCSVRSHF